MITAVIFGIIGFIAGIVLPLICSTAAMINGGKENGNDEKRP